MDLISTLQNTAFWAGLLKIIWVNIILSGDNAVVIALAARSLPHDQQKKAVFLGAGAAVIMRIILTFFAAALLRYPYLKLFGGLLLLWIAVNLLVPEGDEKEITGHSNLFHAIRTILFADLVMSVDNVLAVAATAQGDNILLTLGLLISIPLVIGGATLLMNLMERFPVIILAGAAMIGWVAGEMISTDPVVGVWIADNAPWLFNIHGLPIGEVNALQMVGAVMVIVIGKWLAIKATRSTADTTNSEDIDARRQ